MTRTWYLFALILAAAACAPQSIAEQQTSAAPEAEEPATADKPGSNVQADMILAFAQAACGGCHAVEPDYLSPNSAAPTFPEIVNRKGVTADTLTTWLRDAHNYPEVMDFDLTPSHVGDLTEYMLSLQDEDYKAPIF